MHIIESDMTVFFDVDDTLVIWSYPADRHEDSFIFNNFGTMVNLLPHLKHIEQLKNHKARGHKVICWSAGGYEWCREVVKVLNLEAHVDLVVAKPQFYYDDLTAKEILPDNKRIYFDPFTRKEVTNNFTHKDEDL